MIYNKPIIINLMYVLIESNLTIIIHIKYNNVLYYLIGINH